MPDRKILDEICGDYCRENYCILKEILINQSISDRNLIQIKCVEKYKYEISNFEKKDIGWNEAFRKWTEAGLAKKFAEVYQDGISFPELWTRIFCS